MITEEKLATFRNTILCDVHETTWLELMDTLSALWRVANEAETVIGHPACNLGSASYSKLPQGLGPRLCDLQDALAALREGEER